MKIERTPGRGCKSIANREAASPPATPGVPISADWVSPYWKRSASVCTLVNLSSRAEAEHSYQSTTWSLTASIIDGYARQREISLRSLISWQRLRSTRCSLHPAHFWSTFAQLCLNPLRRNLAWTWMCSRTRSCCIALDGWRSRAETFFERRAGSWWSRATGSCWIWPTSLSATAVDWALWSACTLRRSPRPAGLSSSTWVRKSASSSAWPICCHCLNRRPTAPPASHSKDRQHRAPRYRSFLKAIGQRKSSVFSRRAPWRIAFSAATSFTE